MRILMTTDNFGGVWTYSRELSEGLLEKGCSVALVSLGRIPNADQLSWVDAQASRWGARFHFAGYDTPLEWMRSNGRAMSEAEPLLCRLAREFHADLLLSSQYCFGALRSDLPRVVVAHSDVLSWSQACRTEPLPETDWLAQYRSLVTDGLRGADAVIAPTQWMLNALAANFEIPSRAQVIANGRSVPSAIAQSERRMQAVSAGRLWDEAKNLKILSELDCSIPVLVAGEIEHEHSRVTYPRDFPVLLGALDEQELLGLFRQSSIYICTSVYEPFGLAPLEAALCGCAVLANDIPSLREVWGDAAIYFEDAESLSAALELLTNEPCVLERARTRARERAQHFTAQRMTESYFEFLQNILQPVMAGRYVA